MKLKTHIVLALMSAVLAGCGDASVETVKNAQIAVQPDFTYGNALEKRDTCEKTSWKSDKDATNRSVVEYRCVLKDIGTAIDKVKAADINQVTIRMNSSKMFAEQDVKSLAGSIEAYEKSLRETQALIEAKKVQLAERAKAGLPPLPERATSFSDMTRGEEYMPIGNLQDRAQGIQNMIEQNQRKLAQAQQSQAGGAVDAARRRDAEIARINRRYEQIKGITQIIRWTVTDAGKVVPAHFTAEVESTQGTKEYETMQSNYAAIIKYRGSDYLDEWVPVALFQIPVERPEADTAQAAPSAPKTAGAQDGAACYEAKLADFRKGMGDEAPISQDMMNEWRGECGMPSL
ncbi:MAG TPA: hypothetical protein VGM52_00550 [Herbaspirillum sp.]|jgi:hypothetical protein